MVKRLSALILALILAAGTGLADLKWKENTPGQKMLKSYITNVNEFLTEYGEWEINSIFELYEDHAEMGITDADDSDMPEHVTVTVYLKYDSIHYLLLRADDATRFQRIAAAFLRALNPQTMTAEESLKKPAERAGKAVKNPLDSFEDEVEEEKLSGVSARTFYAYYPNQYHDGVSWMQLMIIFPLPEYWDEESGIINQETGPRALPYDSDQDKEYEGYYSSDDYSHLETFSTPTPEPDSAAAELDDWGQ